jgi:flagellar hook-associated protein 1 FlgK
MASTFFGLDIAKSGLYNTQAALNTTAHNIANADTEGYSRQYVEQSTSTPISVSSRYGMQGTGVDITGINQERDSYYDTKYWDNNKLVGEYTVKEYYMAEIEGDFNELNTDGFTTSFNSFFTSLEELTKNPSSESVRVEVTNYAQNFAEYMQYMSSCLDSIQSEANSEINNVANRINSIATQVAGLTREINSIETTGRQRANDLRDSRANLIDELSKIANVTTEETVHTDTEGVTEFRVRIDGQVVVDTYNVTTLKCVPRERKVNQSDIDGLFDLEWSNGVKFNMASETLSGTLQGLIEIRDGNNKGNLQGITTAMEGDTELVVTDTNINNIDDMNMPLSGTLTIGSKKYTYNSFSVEQIEDEEGNPSYIYTFQLDDAITNNITDSKVSLGNAINYKGVCYYQNKLNQFIRVFARQFNETHKQGVDLNGDFGLDFFVPDDTESTVFDLTGTEYDPEESDETPDILYSTETTYYALTASNVTVNSSIYNNVNKIACASPDNEEGGISNGIENADILKQLYALQSDRDMFKQGTPENFLQTMTAEIGIDSKKAQDLSESQSNIQASIQNQRLSIMSVDIDEEALNLVKFQNSYNLNSHVVSVMNEVYDKLINGTGA